MISPQDQEDASSDRVKLVGIPTRQPIRPRIRRVPPRLHNWQRPQPNIVYARAGQGDGVDVGVVVEVTTGQLDSPGTFDELMRLRQGQDPDQGGDQGQRE